MNGWLEAIIKALSGIFNWYTLFVLVAGAISYILLSMIAVRLDDKEYILKLLARFQFWLDRHNNKRSKWIGKWLWKKIIEIDYDRRRQVAVAQVNDWDERLLALRNLSQVEGAKNVKYTVFAIFSTLDQPYVSTDFSDLVLAVLRELKERNQFQNINISKILTMIPKNTTDNPIKSQAISLLKK